MAQGCLRIAAFGREFLRTVSDDYAASGWFGVGAPKAAPAEIVDKLNQEINAGLADPKLKAQLTDLGGIILDGSPGDFSRLIADERRSGAR